MLRSNISNSDKSDFNIVKDAEHFESVWKIIEKNIPIYFRKIFTSEEQTKVLLNQKILHFFENGFRSYQKEESKYKSFFSEESMDEFEDEDDPKGFKSALSTKVPVILKARSSKRSTMQEWQEKFAASKAVDIYAIFFNLINFQKDYIEETAPIDFENLDKVSDLEKLYALNEDDDYNVPGVIGMGIKSSVLFYLNATYFLGANKNTLYGFYFLSECNHFYLPSQTSEFIMINDTKIDTNRKNNLNILIDQNYWYPYDLFILYSLRTYRKLKQICASYKYILDDKKRFVYVNSFMSGIWDIEYEKILTMTGGDQDDAK